MPPSRLVCELRGAPAPRRGRLTRTHSACPVGEVRKAFGARLTSVAYRGWERHLRCTPPVRLWAAGPKPPRGRDTPETRHSQELSPGCHRRSHNVFTGTAR